MSNRHPRSPRCAPSESVVLEVQVVPRASRERLGPRLGDGRLKVQLTAPPVEGEANQALVRLLARTLGIGASAIELVRGETGRKKTLRLTGASPAAIAALGTTP
jgi:uncharacterized protein